MGKFDRLNPKYQIPYEYSVFIKAKTKYLHKYLLFQLILNLLEEMYSSIYCYRLLHRHILAQFNAHYRNLYVVKIYIGNFLDYLHNYLYGAQFFSERIVSSMHKLLHNNSQQFFNLDISKQAYLFFVKLLLLLLKRRITITNTINRNKITLHYAKQISHYLFSEKFNIILLNLNENIMSYDLRKRIMDSIFNVNRYSEVHRFRSKKHILTMLTFSIILSRNRFDLIKMPKRQNSFFMDKLKFRQLYKIVCNLKTTNKFNKYVRFVSSKISNSIELESVYFLQINKFVQNYLFHFLNSSMRCTINTLQPSRIWVNSRHYKGSDFHYFLIGDRIEIKSVVVTYLLTLRKLYIVFAITQLFYHCITNFEFELTEHSAPVGYRPMHEFAKYKSAYGSLDNTIEFLIDNEMEPIKFFEPECKPIGLEHVYHVIYTLAFGSKNSGSLLYIKNEFPNYEGKNHLGSHMNKPIASIGLNYSPDEYVLLEDVPIKREIVPDINTLHMMAPILNIYLYYHYNILLNSHSGPYKLPNYSPSLYTTLRTLICQQLQYIFSWIHTNRTPINIDFTMYDAFDADMEDDSSDDTMQVKDSDVQPLEQSSSSRISLLKANGDINVHNLISKLKDSDMFDPTNFESDSNSIDDLDFTFDYNTEMYPLSNEEEIEVPHSWVDIKIQLHDSTLKRLLLSLKQGYLLNIFTHTSGSHTLFFDFLATKQDDLNTMDFYSRVEPSSQLLYKKLLHFVTDNENATTLGLFSEEEDKLTNSMEQSVAMQSKELNKTRETEEISLFKMPVLSDLVSEFDVCKLISLKLTQGNLVLLFRLYRVIYYRVIHLIYKFISVDHSAFTRSINSQESILCVSQFENVHLVLFPYLIHPHGHYIKNKLFKMAHTILFLQRKIKIENCSELFDTSKYLFEEISSDIFVSTVSGSSPETNSQKSNMHSGSSVSLSNINNTSNVRGYHVIINPLQKQRGSGSDRNRRENHSKDQNIFKHLLGLRKRTNKPNRDIQHVKDVEPKSSKLQMAATYYKWMDINNAFEHSVLDGLVYSISGLLNRVLIRCLNYKHTNDFLSNSATVSLFKRLTVYSTQSRKIKWIENFKGTKKIRGKLQFFKKHRKRILDRLYFPNYANSTNNLLDIYSYSHVFINCCLYLKYIKQWMHRLLFNLMLDENEFDIHEPFDLEYEEMEHIEDHLNDSDHSELVSLEKESTYNSDSLTESDSETDSIALSSSGMETTSTHNECEHVTTTDLDLDEIGEEESTEESMTIDEFSLIETFRTHNEYIATFFKWFIMSPLLYINVHETLKLVIYSDKHEFGREPTTDLNHLMPASLQYLFNRKSHKMLLPKFR